MGTFFNTAQSALREMKKCLRTTKMRLREFERMKSNAINNNRQEVIVQSVERRK